MNTSYLLDIITVRIVFTDTESINSSIGGLLVTITAKIKGTRSKKVITGVNVLQIGSLTATIIEYGQDISFTALGIVGMKVAIIQ